MTNATKANIAALINALLGLLIGLGAIDLTAEQVGLVIGVWNAAAVAYMGLTYKASPLRIPDTALDEHDNN